MAADRTSILPSIKYENLVLPSTTTNSTIVMSPNIAEATALQMSTSKPLHSSPVSSSHPFSENPVKSILVPQVTTPLSKTLSSVLPYVGLYSGLSSSVTFIIFLICSSVSLCSLPNDESTPIIQKAHIKATISFPAGMNITNPSLTLLYLGF